MNESGSEKARAEKSEPPEVVELTVGPFKGRKYVRLEGGKLGPRWYDDLQKEKP